MKKVFLLALLVASQLCVQAASKPANALRITDHIPLGTVEKDFLALLSGTLTIQEKSEVNLTTMCRYKYNRDLLKDVLRYDELTHQYYAYPTVTKMYVVENPPLWPRHQRVEFIFYRSYGSDMPFTLFAIHSVHKVEVGDMNTVFERKLAAATENRHGDKPLILNTSFYLRDAEPVPARMAVWRLTTSREILFVPDNGTLLFAEFSYADELDYKAWVEASAACKAAAKKAK